MSSGSSGDEWMLVCPVCSQACDERDPVVAEDGATYCRQCIAAWHHSLRERGELVISAVSREPMGESLEASSVASDESVPKTTVRSVQNITSLNGVFSQLDSVRDILSASLGGWQPPEVVMIGEESSGKSSVLERLAMMPIFPRGDKLTTRLPIVVRLRNAETALPPRLEVVDNATGKTEVGPYVIPSVSGHIDVSNAMNAVLQEEQRAFPAHKISLTRKIVLHIENPMVPSIDLVDLPGLVRTGQAGEDTKKLAEEYIAANNQHSIYLLTCPASTAPTTSLSAGLVLEKQLESRTVGIFTMCDEAVSTRLKARLEERLQPDATDDDGILPLCPHGWVAAMNAHIEHCDNFQRLRDQATAEEAWMTANMPAALAKRCGSGAVIERVSQLFHEYMSKSWVPRTTSKITQELEATRIQDILLGLPRLQAEPERALELAVAEAARVLDSDAWKVARTERFCQEILQPLKDSVVASLDTPLKDVPLEVFAHQWQLKCEGVERACRSAAARWPLLVAEHISALMLQVPCVPASETARKKAVSQPPFVLARFPAFVEAVGAEMQARIEGAGEAALAQALELVRSFFVNFDMPCSNLHRALTKGRVGVNLTSSRPSVSMANITKDGDALAEKLVLVFVCRLGVYSEPVSPLLERAASGLSQADWEEACASQRCNLAQRTSDLERALQGVRGFKFPRLTILASMMEEKLADEAVQVQGCEQICALLPTHDNARTEWRYSDVGAREEMMEDYRVCGNLGAVRALVSAMQAHPASPVVQSLASKALAILARNAENARAVVDQGGLEAVLSAMQAATELIDNYTEEGEEPLQAYAAVQLGGCWLLRNLLATEDDSIKVRIASLSGTQAVCDAMQHHCDNSCTPNAHAVGIQEHGCCVLHFLVDGTNKENVASNRNLAGQREARGLVAALKDTKSSRVRSWAEKAHASLCGTTE